jgi:hypothetical protein
MIPTEIACLAEALCEEFNLDFDEGVRAAYKITKALNGEGISLEQKETA